MDYSDPDKIATSLFFEIFQDTSTGDIGLQLACGPMFRCHREVLVKCGGLLPRVRCFPNLPIKVGGSKLEIDRYPEPTYHEAYIRMNQSTGKVRRDLLEDIGYSAFSRHEAGSCLGSKSGTGAEVDRLYFIGSSSATELSGQMGTVTRRDPFTLAERYEVDEQYEPFFELMRYAYKGYFAYLRKPAHTDEEKRVKCRNMREMLYMGARFAVDTLFDVCLEWFIKTCFAECGQAAFLEVFFQLEHYVEGVAEKMMKDQLYDGLLEMLSFRPQFDAVTQDPRWASLHVDFVENVLTDDRLAIQSEAEVLGLIDRWNASADKPKELLVRLLGAFRPDMESIEKLKGGPVSSVLKALLDRAAPPRGGKEVQAQAAALKKAKAAKDEGVFGLHEHGDMFEEGYSFMLQKGRVILQQHAIRTVGTRRLRMTMSQSSSQSGLWNQNHEFFCGLSFGTQRYFGFLVKLTDFQSIYSFQVWSSAAPLPLDPKHLTGAGNKVEFDLLLGVEMSQYNGVVPCSLRVLHNSTTVTVANFEVSADVLTDEGPGLKYMVTAAGFGEHEELEALLAWVGGGDAMKTALVLD
jgi:hypothetical protein